MNPLADSVACCRAILRPVMLRGAAVLCLVFGGAGAGLAADPGVPFNTRFAALAFHDVVDQASELDDDAITSDRLVAFFDWLRASGWTPVSLDDVERARRGERPLPARAVLLSVDDGYRSLYTRVYPLALAYRYPIVAALVGQWMEAPAGGTVRYGERDVPREHFIGWNEAREMQASGLVEFALHSHAMHTAVRANPQGNTMPAASARRVDGAGAYESEAAFAERLRSDLARGRALLQRELGRAPRAMVWPYGRYAAVGVREAAAVGYAYLLTLDEGPADARRPLAIARHLPSGNASLADLVASLEPDPNDVPVRRLACVDPASLWSVDAAETDARLGRLIERARTLGLTGVVVDAVQRDAQGRAVAAWFPTGELPLAGDLLSRVAWQLQTRAGVAVYGRLPHRTALAALGGDAARVQRLYADLGAHVPLSGWVLEDAAPITETSAAFERPPPRFGDPARERRGWSRWLVRDRRAAEVDRLRVAPGADAVGWDAYATLDAARPALQLLWLAPPSAPDAPTLAHALADASLVPAPGAGAGAVSADARLVRWFADTPPPDAGDLSDRAEHYLRAGGVSFGWCPDDAQRDRPAAAALAPGVSAATFPARR